MKFSYKSDYFVPALVVSMTAHLLTVQAGRLAPGYPQLSVLQAPNSIEVVIIEEQKPVPVKKTEMLRETIEEMTPETMEIPDEIMTSELPEESLPETIVTEAAHPKKMEPAVEPEMVSAESLGVVNEAKPLEHINPAPPYPAIARHRGWEGIVWLDVHVNKHGLVDRVDIQKGSGYNILDRSAVKAVGGWRFVPAQRNSQNISSEVVVPIEFKLISR